jgi:hypothetical protein
LLEESLLEDWTEWPPVPAEATDGGANKEKREKTPERAVAEPA